MSAAKTCLVVGAGEGTGAAVARRFAQGGLTVCVARREADKLAPLVAEIENSGGKAYPFGIDSTNEAQVIDLFERIERDVGPLEAVVFNVARTTRANIADTSAEVYRAIWELSAFAGFLVGREAARRMTPRRRGTIIFTGATSSLRGKEGFAAFSGGKQALRALAQSMARELGPQGLHVAHVVVDGIIDTPFTRSKIPDRMAAAGPDGVLDPAHLAEVYWQIHGQPRDTWTHEVDLRPWSEPW